MRGRHSRRVGLHTVPASRPLPLPAFPPDSAVRAAPHIAHYGCGACAIRPAVRPGCCCPTICAAGACAGGVAGGGADHTACTWRTEGLASSKGRPPPLARRALTTSSPTASRAPNAQFLAFGGAPPPYPPYAGILGEIWGPYADPRGENAPPEMPNLYRPRASLGPVSCRSPRPRRCKPCLPARPPRLLPPRCGCCSPLVDWLDDT